MNLRAELYKEQLELARKIDKKKLKLGIKPEEDIRCEIDSNGDKHWYNKQNQYHRINGPAVERISGNKHWYQNGKRHRIDGPAVEYVSGYKAWYKNGKCHRTDGPAVEWADGRKEYWKNDELIKKE